MNIKDYILSYSSNSIIEVKKCQKFNLKEKEKQAEGLILES